MLFAHGSQLDTTVERNAWQPACFFAHGTQLETRQDTRRNEYGWACMSPHVRNMLKTKYGSKKESREFYVWAIIRKLSEQNHLWLYFRHFKGRIYTEIMYFIFIWKWHVVADWQVSRNTHFFNKKLTERVRAKGFLNYSDFMYLMYSKNPISSIWNWPVS